MLLFAAALALYRVGEVMDAVVPHAPGELERRVQLSPGHCGRTAATTRLQLEACLGRGLERGDRGFRLPLS